MIEALGPVLALAGRNLLGWYEANRKAHGDAYVKYDWKKLADTGLRMGLYGVFAYYSISQDVTVAAALSGLLDLGFKQLKK